MNVEAALPKAIAELVGTFTGHLLTSANDGYEEARKLHNGLIDKRPALIARCRNTADIVDAVALARRLGLEIAVRGGGHNVAGRASVDGGLMVDLSLMKGIHVDPNARTARVQGGATWNDLNRETLLHGLATTGGVISSTGVAGLTLGGGLGWLMGKHGLALDNLLSVEIVTADGRVLQASSIEHPDLFWALRGGGGNFGVVSSFEFKLHPVGPMVTGGLVAHPIGRAGETLRFFRDVTRELPDELVVFAGLTYAPDGSGEKLAVLIACHCGDAAAAEAALKPIKDFGPPVMDAMGPVPYGVLNTTLDAGVPRGALNYWKSSFLSSLSDGAIDAMIEQFARCPTAMGAIMLEHFHGAACRVGVSDTAFPHRGDGYNMLVLGQWMDPGETTVCTAWTRETYDALKPFMAKARYSNYLGDDETDVMAAAYGPNYARLQKIKDQYDPYNIFHLNQNILPAR